MNPLNALALCCVAGLAMYATRLLHGFFRALRHGDPGGTHVAEVWLEWEICRGSTLFRAAYATPARAARAAKLHAWLLHQLLPSHYRAEYSDGRPYLEPYDFEVLWGVRPLVAFEEQNGVTVIWSPLMPGTRSDRGEHRDAHPALSAAKGALDVPNSGNTWTT